MANDLSTEASVGFTFNKQRATRPNSGTEFLAMAKKSLESHNTRSCLII